MRTPVKVGAVDRQGISNLTSESVAAAREEGLRYKLVCSCTREADGSVSASVRPEKLPPTHSLYHVSGASSAVRLETDELGPITVLSEDPTNSDTAFGLLTDMLTSVSLCLFCHFVGNS